MPQIVNVNLKNNPYNIIIGDNIVENIDNLHKQYFGKRSKIIIFDKKLSNSVYFKLLTTKLGKDTKSISIPSGEKHYFLIMS